MIFLYHWLWLWFNNRIYTIHCFLLGFFFFGQLAYPNYHFRRQAVQDSSAQHRPFGRPPKPEWVRREVVRLKALMPHDGCRKVAETFNRLHASKHEISVGKSYVSQTIKTYRYEIRVLRRSLKNKTPRPLPKNLIWSLDLTQLTDADNQTHTLLGLVDAGTRACLCLERLPNKASITLLRCLLEALERFGNPKVLRTDNEAVFTSRLFRFGVWLLGIRHQRSEKYCPWQNGRIERFFGTLKERLKHHTVRSLDTLTDDLNQFRFWFNHIRVHQFLSGRTPAEAWRKTEPNPQGQALYYQGWDGTLSGFYLPPG